jgi:hypothetical protein
MYSAEYASRVEEHDELGGGKVSVGRCIWEVYLGGVFGRRVRGEMGLQ